MSDRDCPLSPALRRMLQAAYERDSTISVELAKALGLQPKTIDNMFAQAENLLGVSGRSGTLTRALKQGWIQQGDPQTAERTG